MIPRTFYLAPNETDSRGELKQFIDFNAKYKSPGENLRTESPVKDVLACVKDSVDPAEAVGCIWILKPASYANRGFGIKVVRGLQAALDVAQRLNSAGSQRSDCTGVIFMHEADPCSLTSVRTPETYRLLSRTRFNQRGVQAARAFLPGPIRSI